MPQELRGIFRISMNGNSACIYLPRPLLFSLAIVPGERIELWTDGDGIAHFRKWEAPPELNRRSVGLVNSKPDEAKP